MWESPEFDDSMGNSLREWQSRIGCASLRLSLDDDG